MAESQSQAEHLDNLSTKLENVSVTDPMLKNADGVEIWKLGEWKLQNGSSIPDAFIAYKTFGDPKSPAIVYPSWYSGCKHSIYNFISIMI